MPPLESSTYAPLNTEPDAPYQPARELEEREGVDDLDLPEYDQVHLASHAEKKRLWWRGIFINSIFVGGWFGFATLLSVYNKWFFADDRYAFPAPLFVTSIQMFVQFTLASILRFAFPKQFKPDRRPSSGDYLKKVVPTAITTGLDIGLSNLSLKAITLSFYTMCKSSSLIFVLGFAFYFGLETFSLRLSGVIFLIFLGVLLMVATETHFMLGGFLLVTSASALSGLRWSLTQTLLKNKKIGLDSPPVTLFWITPIMGITLAIISFVVDSWRDIFYGKFFATPADVVSSCLFLLAPGIIAFLMVISEFYVIQRAGVVPMSITAVAKEVTTIMVSAIVFGDELTPLNLTGVGITICGISLYTYHKYRMSVDSPVPLDGHGNPITEEDSEMNDGGLSLGSDRSYIELGNTNQSEGAGDHGAENERPLLTQDILFDAETGTPTNHRPS